MMALFANIPAADFKKGNIIMFAMVSSSPDRVASRANQCLGGQFACAPMYYAMFWASLMSQMVVGGWLWGVFWQRERVSCRI